MKGMFPHYLTKHFCYNSSYHYAKSWLVPTCEGTYNMAHLDIEFGE